MAFLKQIKFRSGFFPFMGIFLTLHSLGFHKPQYKKQKASFTSCLSCDPSRIRVMWDDPDLSGTNIRNAPGGKIINVIYPKDFPDGCYFEVVAQVNGWFKIDSKIFGTEKNLINKGGSAWIHRSVISVSTSNYGNQKIPVRSAPAGGTIVTTINKEANGIRILDLCGSWVKISYKGKTGWIASKWICSIPWTTCS